LEVLTVVDIPAKLIDFAERTEGAAIIDGETPQGLPVLVIVVTGANVGVFKKLAKDILPGLTREREPDWEYEDDGPEWGSE
jgi:hypothetical protein